jgi:hypothetical protein
MTHRTLEQLDAGLPRVLAAPAEQGTVRLVVRRPGPDQREVVSEGRLDTEQGLVGDDWIHRPGRHTGQPPLYAQITVMNARFCELISGDPDPASWTPSGDQLYLDLDISEANLPPGTRIAVGEAVLEIRPEPHTGCVKFRDRWGQDVLRFASSEQGRALRLRGANTTVVRTGTVRPGDVVRKLGPEP